MEADSTTNDIKNEKTENHFPFTVHPRNLKYYMDIIEENVGGTRETQLVQRLQSIGLIPKILRCPKGEPDCHMFLKEARVVDRVQWVCKSCCKKLPVRQGSFFLRLQCSIRQVLQIVLAWCEDADWETAGQFFGVKPRVVSQIYDKLDQLAVQQQGRVRLGGDGAVVVAEMYPDCLNRLSPDTTEQTHVHRILMLADTKHIPTRYWLHVIKQDSKKSSDNGSLDSKALTKEVSEVVSRAVAAGSLLLAGAHVPPLPAAASVHALLAQASTDVAHFLCTGIWRRALLLCSASRDMCAGAGAGAGAGPGAGRGCAAHVQRYLNTALYRPADNAGFYEHVLRLLAEGH